MPELVVDGDRRMIEVGGFRLAFTWTGHRWVHSLEHRPRGQENHRVLAVSFEGDPDRDDPARVVSPAYQDLQFQRRGEALQALLVGQSGPHHFSAVFEVEACVLKPSLEWPHPDPPQYVDMRVDVADRCRAEVEYLASTYHVDASSSDILCAMPTCIDWDVGSNRLTFYAEHDGPTQLAWAEAGRRAIRVQSLAAIKPAASTHRLQYVWRWEPDINP